MYCLWPGERDFLSLCSSELSLHTESDRGLVSKTSDIRHDSINSRYQDAYQTQTLLYPVSECAVSYVSKGSSFQSELLSSAGFTGMLSFNEEYLTSASQCESVLFLNLAGILWIAL